MKRLFSLSLTLIVIAALFTSLACGGVTAPSDKQNRIPTLQPGVTAVPSVWLEITVNASSILKLENVDNSILEAINSDGLIVNASKLSIPKGSTVSDVLRNVCRLLGLSLNAEAGEYGTFVKGIGGISNGDFGTDSFWLLKVNGEFADVGGDYIEVNDGDSIEWVYTCDGGADSGYVMSGNE